MPNEQEITQRVVERMKLAQPQLDKLTPEHKRGIYGVVFDRYIKPNYKKLKLSDSELVLAKNQWIDSVSGGKPQPLPQDFGVDKTPPSTGKKVLAGLEAGGAGVLGGVRNVSEFISKFDKSDLSKDPIHKALSDVEHKAYEDALAIDPSVAKYSAGAGRMVAAQIAFEGAGGVIPKAGLLRSAVGAAAAAPVYGASGIADVGLQTGINVAVDALLGGLGKVGARGARTVISKFNASKNPVAVEAVKQIETAGKRVVTEKFNGRPVSELTPAEFQEWHKQTTAAVEAERVKSSEAAQGVRDAKRAAEPTAQEKVIARAREQDAKEKARRAASDASKALQKGISEYKKRTGNIPEGEHLELLKQRKTVEDILGAAPKAVDKVMKDVTNEVEARVLQEGSPQTLEAVQAIKDIAPAVEEAPKVTKAAKEPMFKTDVSSIIGATTAEEFGRAKKDALVALKTEAQQKAKTIKSTAEGLKIAEEARKEERRINAIAVPESIGKKAVDRERKSSEKTFVGMAVAEAEKGQEAKTVGLKAEKQMADPEIGVIDALDHQKELLKQLELLLPSAVSRVKKAMASDTIEVQNYKIETAIKALAKLKKTEAP